MLSHIAEELGLNDYLFLSRGERRDIGKARLYILANAVEAVIGAVYLDQGYDAAARLIIDRIGDGHWLPRPKLALRNASFSTLKDADVECMRC